MEDHCEPMDTVSETASVFPDASGNSFESQKQLTGADLNNLYASLGILAGNTNDVRYEAIHLRTSNELNVTDVIDYFAKFNPEYVEVVDEQSVNVVWQDRLTTAKALFSVSQTVAGKPVQAMPSSMIDNMKIPFGCWLLGKDHINLSSVLLRFSMRSDKKPRTREPCSRYSRNNNHTVNTLPINKKNPWGNLSQCWDESYELSDRNRKQGARGDFRDRVMLKGRRRNQH